MSSVKLILLEDVENLGKAGEEVNVSPGFARNYLLPGDKATKASPGALRQLAARREKIEQQRLDELEAAKVLAQKIAGAEIAVSMEANEEDQLFGSVTSRIIADTLANEGIEVEHHRIQLQEPLKELGLFNVEIKLHPEVTATAKVWVVRT